jgi:hypothetical protein
MGVSWIFQRGLSSENPHGWPAIWPRVAGTVRRRGWQLPLASLLQAVGGLCAPSAIISERRAYAVGGAQSPVRTQFCMQTVALEAWSRPDADCRRLFAVGGLPVAGLRAEARSHLARTCDPFMPSY